MQIRGPGGGSGHDQLAVSGSISLNGATLSLGLENITTIASGQPLLMVVNDGNDAISGTFFGLQEGAAIPLPGVSEEVLSLSYRGGDGNDVSLTLGPAPVPVVIESVTFTRGGGIAGTDRITITGTGQPSGLYHLEASANLKDDWTQIRSFSAAASGAFCVLIDQTAGFPNRFFRLTR